MKQFLVFLLVIATLTTQAQKKGKPSVFDLFDTDKYREITIESDFHHLKKNKNRNDYQPATLRYTGDDGSTVIWDIEIKPRGKMRRRVCSMPPLKISFQEEAVKAKGLSKNNTLEMVEICNPGKSFEQFVLKEYVAYKLYNMLTDLSLRVQLVKLKFVNTGDKTTLNDGFAYLIEDNKEMAKRLGGKILEPKSIGSRLPNTQQKELFCLFQFMIGNTDWFTITAHNLDYFSRRDSVMAVPIPYDFDYSGFVNTSYSVPNDRTPLEHVTQRYYQGPCRTHEETQKTLQLFHDRKAMLLNYCETFPYFTKSTRKQTLKYLTAFYKIIENKKAVKNLILDNCDKYEVPVKPKLNASASSN